MNDRRFVWLGVLAIFVVGAIFYPKVQSVIVGMPSSADAKQPPAAGEPGAGGSRPGAMRSPPIAVTTAVAQEKDVPITATYVGSVEPIASVAVRTRIDGVVVKEPVNEGDTVKAGDVLFQLDDATIRASIAKDQAMMAKDQATLDQANIDLKAMQDLVSRGVDTTQQGQQQQATVAVDAANVAADKAQLQSDQLQLGYATITAPIDGRIGAVSVSVGALIHATDTTPLLTITRMAPVRVSFDVPQRDLAAFRQALAASPPASVAILDPDTGKPVVNGSLTFIDSSVDNSSGTVTAKAEVANADEALWPGEYVRVQAQVGDYPKATVVPTVSVQLNGTSSFVFLVKPDATVTRQPVTVADTSGDTAVISSGLKPGDRVVVDGQLRLTEGSPVRDAKAAGPASKAS